MSYNVDCLVSFYNVVMLIDLQAVMRNQTRAHEKFTKESSFGKIYFDISMFCVRREICDASIIRTYI